jgi:phospholipid/cholesterol/gamma-HCH transport system substrate-binding protein
MTRRLSIAGLVVMLVLSSGCSLQTAGAPRGHLTLLADFNDAQHLLAGHAVRVGDVQVGSVTKVALNGYHARVTMSIVDGHRVPIGTSAVLGLTSLLGENFVQLRYPQSFDPQRGPFMKSGDLLADSTAQPQLEDVTQQAITLLGAISTGDLTTIVNTAAQAVNGRGDELHRLVGQLAQVGEVYAGQSTNLASAVDGLAQLGASLGVHASDIGSLIDNLSNATATAAGQRDRIIGTVQRLTQLAQALDDHVLVPHAAQLTTLLAQLDPIVGTVANQRTTLQDLITNLAGFMTVLPKSYDNGALLLYAWFASLVLPNGTRVPTSSVTGSKAIASLLAPVR